MPGRESGNTCRCNHWDKKQVRLRSLLRWYLAVLSGINRAFLMETISKRSNLVEEYLSNRTHEFGWGEVH